VVGERERIARFLNRDADDQLLHPRIRVLQSVGLAWKFLTFEAEHQTRKRAIAAVNRRIKKVEAPSPAAPDDRGLKPGHGQQVKTPNPAAW
jgi:hypothetical protein